MYPPADNHRRAGIDFQILVVKNRELKNRNGIQANVLLDGGGEISVTAAVQLRVGENAVGGLVAEQPRVLAVRTVYCQLVARTTNTPWLPSDALLNL